MKWSWTTFATTSSPAMTNPLQKFPRKNRKGDDPKVIGLWKIGRTIGKGSSGRVRIARHAKTGQYAAVKIVSKVALVNSRMTMQGLDEQAERILLGIEREIVIMKLIEHPNIMRLYDVWETSTELYLILEYVEGGELFDYLCNKGRLSPAEALGYFQQIISAIDYCHRFNIAHRDLKPENLLLDRDKNIKVADFGMAAWQKNNGNGLLQTACGSPHYAAPEVIEGRAYDGSRSDIWSCGVILFALLAGRLPFDDEDLHALLEKVKIGRFEMPGTVDSRAQDLIYKMLEKDVTKRITIPDILRHPFYTSQKPKMGKHAPPSLDVIARPLVNQNAIDPDIFANLRTLWHGTPDEDIVSKLGYRTKRLEEYDEKQEEMLRELSRRRKIKNRTSEVDPATHPRDTGRNGERLAPTPTLLTPQNFYSPMSQGDTSLSPSPLSPNFPPTPMGAASPVPPLSPASPIWEALNMAPPDVPEMQDEKVQQFFHQIVEHLNVMQIRANAAGSPLMMSPNPHAAGLPDTSDPIQVLTTGKQALGHLGFVGQTGQYASDTATRPLSIRRLRRPSPLDLDKENAHRADVEAEGGDIGGAEETMGRKSSLKRKGGGRRAALGDRRVQIVEPSEDERAKLRRKKSSMNGASSPLSLDSPSVASPLSPAWFGNLFKLKPASFCLLSVHDAQASRDECNRLLNSIGVRVVLTHAESHGILKCKVDEHADPASPTGLMKAVRFRVEVQRATQLQADSGYQSSLQMIQEKGALSSFKLVYSRLKREWDLDAPQIPLLVSSPALTDDGNFADLLYI
ncbi:Pkinase-domain-containing protein [Dentipellis sp. KUC8613]|nr:Pkinase-domain-containing protein [Dentipellis sp. KUC8613]